MHNFYPSNSYEKRPSFRKFHTVPVGNKEFTAVLSKRRDFPPLKQPRFTVAGFLTKVLLPLVLLGALIGTGYWAWISVSGNTAENPILNDSPLVPVYTGNDQNNPAGGVSSHGWRIMDTLKGFWFKDNVPRVDPVPEEDTTCYTSKDRSKRACGVCAHVWRIVDTLKGFWFKDDVPQVDTVPVVVPVLEEGSPCYTRTNQNKRVCGVCAHLWRTVDTLKGFFFQKAHISCSQLDSDEWMEEMRNWA